MTIEQSSVRAIATSDPLVNLETHVKPTNRSYPAESSTGGKQSEKFYPLCVCGMYQYASSNSVGVELGLTLGGIWLREGGNSCPSVFSVLDSWVNEMNWVEHGRKRCRSVESGLVLPRPVSATLSHDRDGGFYSGTSARIVG